MRPIVIFYHCLFCIGDPPEPSPHGIAIVADQMELLKKSGLLAAAKEFYVGINGSEESQVYADGIIPEKAVKFYHGTHCKNEIRTVMLMQQIVAGKEGWNVLYFHPKGFSHPPTEEMSHNWRNCMNHYLIGNWEICIESLKVADMAGCHWKKDQVDGTQCLWAGNFYWSKSEFLNTLPRIEKNPRIPLMGGLDSHQSRYEAEIIPGTGPKRPKVIDYHPTGPFTCGRK